MDRVDFHCRLAWLTDAQLAAAQRTARERGHGHRARPRPRGRRTPRRAPTPGRNRTSFARGHDRRRAARRLQLPRPGLGSAALAPGRPRRRRLRPLPRPPARPVRGTPEPCASTTSWACSGSGGSRRAIRPPRGRTSVRRRGDARRPRPGGPPRRAPSSSARTSARSSPACARRSPRAACSAPRCSGSSATGTARAGRSPPRSGARTAWPPPPPTTCRPPRPGSPANTSDCATASAC